MKTALLEEVPKDDTEIVLAEIDIADLIRNGLRINEDMEVLPGFRGMDVEFDEQLEDPLISSIQVCDDAEGERFLTVHIVYRTNGRILNAHTFINQDFQLLDWEDEWYFFCPLSNECIKCKTVYLRKDYPLFGSAKFLNIKE